MQPAHAGVLIFFACQEQPIADQALSRNSSFENLVLQIYLCRVPKNLK